MMLLALRLFVPRKWTLPAVRRKLVDGYKS
jgi:hypothetical protein